MSVIGAIPVEYQRFSGYRDFRYPEGFWFASVSAVGDASGGTVNLQLTFAAAINVRNSRLYSVEQLSTDSSLTVAAVPRLQSTNMAGPSTGTLAHRYVLNCPLSEVTNAPATDPASLLMLPLFLGAQRGLNLAAHLNLTYANVNTILFVFEAQGYWWGPRSILVDGGPQRPPSGLYRA